jgi:hypothetical protein
MGLQDFHQLLEQALLHESRILPPPLGATAAIAGAVAVLQVANTQQHIRCCIESSRQMAQHFWGEGCCTAMHIRFMHCCWEPWFTSRQMI